MDIAKDISDAIEKQLPAAVGEVLRARLEQADKDAKLAATQKDRIAELLRENTQLQNRVDARDAQLKAHGDLAKRETELAERERNLRVTMLEGQLAAAHDKTKFAQDVALGLVRNVEYRHSVFANSTKQVAMPPGGGYTQSMPESSNTTDTSSAA